MFADPWFRVLILPFFSTKQSVLFFKSEWLITYPVILFMSVLTIISSMPDLLPGFSYFLLNNFCTCLVHSLNFCLESDSSAGYKILIWWFIFFRSLNIFLHCFPSSVTANRITTVSLIVVPCRTGCGLSDSFNISSHFSCPVV